MICFVRAPSVQVSCALRVAAAKSTVMPFSHTVAGKSGLPSRWLSIPSFSACKRVKVTADTFNVKPPSEHSLVIIVQRNIRVVL